MPEGFDWLQVIVGAGLAGRGGEACRGTACRPHDGRVGQALPLPLFRADHENRAKRLGVRRLDAAFAQPGPKAVLRGIAPDPKSQGGVKPPHSKVPSAHRF